MLLENHLQVSEYFDVHGNEWHTIQGEATLIASLENMNLSQHTVETITRNIIEYIHDWLFTVKLYYTEVVTTDIQGKNVII